jgi:hypothetical protein
VAVIVCASPGLHADRSGSFVQPKAEYAVDTFISYEYTADKSSHHISVAFLLCWLWPSLLLAHHTGVYILIGDV